MVDAEAELRLSAQLEAELMRELGRCYDRISWTHFAERLKRPVIVLSEAAQRLGQWIPKTRTLELQRALVLARPWPEVLAVLEHEMAHQYVDEVLQIRDESAHGETFRRICEERGIDARAHGAPIVRSGTGSGNGTSTSSGHSTSTSTGTSTGGGSSTGIGSGGGTSTGNTGGSCTETGNGASDGQAGTAGATAGATERTLERIRKLFALAGSSNRHEAEAAMKRAHELMLRHNLEQLPVVHEFEVRHLGEPRRRANVVESEVVGLLSELFFVEVIAIPVYVPQTAVHARVYEIAGTRANVEMASHVHAFLLATCDRLWRENRADARVRSGRDRISYQTGVIRGFRDKLLAERVELRGVGLVWRGDARLAEFYRRRNPRIVTRRRSLRVGGAHHAGREAGRNVVLHKPVTPGGSGGGPKLLRG